MLQRGLVALVACACLAAGPVARAQSPAELQLARELFAQAEKDERASDWAAALEKLRRVAQIKVTPGIRFHMALCEERLDQLVSALDDYARAETQANNERNAEVLAALKEPVASLRSRIPRLIVRVPNDMSQAVVTLDGKPLAAGYWGAELPVERGTHTVEARAAGRRPFSKSVATPEREITMLDVVLVDEAKGSKAAPTPLPRVDGRPEPRSSEAPRAAPSSGAKTGAILATAGAVALAGFGVLSFLLAEGKQSDGKEQCAQRPADIACDDLRGPVRTWDALALGSWIAGGALGAVAVVLWLAPQPGAGATGAAPRGAPATAAAGARVFFGPGTAGVSGRF